MMEIWIQKIKTILLRVEQKSKAVHFIFDFIRRVKGHSKVVAFGNWLNQKPLVIRIKTKLAHMEWAEKVAFIVGGVTLLLFLSAPYSLLYRNTRTIVTEAQMRGEILALYLASSNLPAFVQNQEVLYSVEAVVHELGVEDAMITDSNGTVLAPVDRFGQVLPQIKKVKDPAQCSRFVSGLDYEFICPVFYWIEKEEGFTRQNVGFSYLRYSARDSLDLDSSRLFQFVRYFFIFLILGGAALYLILKITEGALTDFKFKIRESSRTGEILQSPSHFKLLSEIAEEILEYKKTGSELVSMVQAGQGQDWLINIFQDLESFMGVHTVLLNQENTVIYVAEAIREKLKISVNLPLVRAIQDSPLMDELLNVMGEFSKDSSKKSVGKLSDGSQLRRLSLNCGGVFYTCFLFKFVSKKKGNS